MSELRAFDPITLEILWQRLVSAVDEASVALIRAAFSTIVRESHAPDIGGRTGNHDLRDVYEEGVQIPPLKLLRRGKPDETLVAMLAANVRAPEAVVGDLWAQLASLDIIDARVVSLMGEYGLDALDGLSDEIQRRTEAAMRRAVAAVPAGTYRHAFDTDGVLGHPIHIEMAMTFAPTRPTGGSWPCCPTCATTRACGALSRSSRLKARS